MIPQLENSTPQNFVSCTELLKILCKITLRLCEYGIYETNEFNFRLWCHPQNIMYMQIFQNLEKNEI